MLHPKFGTVKEYFKNQVIFKEGQLGNEGYLIRTGKIEIYKIIDNEKKVLNLLGPGEVFGEMGIVTQTPRTAFAEAVQYCELVVIDRETIHKMLQKSPKLIQSVTLLLIKRLASTLEMLSDHDEDPLNPQKISSVCHLLSLMAGYEKTVDYHTFCKKAVPITQTDQSGIYTILRRLHQLQVIHIDGNSQDAKTSGRIIRIINDKKLLK